MHCAIVGMGLVGRVMALMLLKSMPKVSLTCMDKAACLQEKASCGYAAAGMVSPIAELALGDFRLYQQGITSLQLWQQIAQYIGASDILQSCGTLVLSPYQSADDFYHFCQGIKRFSIAKESMKVLTHEGARAIEAQLNYSALHREILHLPGEASIHVPKLFKSSADYLSRDGRVDCQAREIINIESLLTEYDFVFDTRGLGARQDIAQLRGVRGEAMVVHAPNISINRAIRIMHPRYPLYVVPRGRSYYYIGASSIEAEDYSPISLKSLMELSSALYCISAGFSEARIIKTLTHCRPSLDDGFPYVSYDNNLIRLNGFYRHGYLLAPALCQQVIERCKVAGS